MRIVFMGTPQFAVVSLQEMLAAGFDITAVVTAPDKPAGRGLQLKTSPIKQTALAANLPVLQPEKLKDPQFTAKLQSLQPDLIVVVAFRILPEEVFMIPPRGAINLHGSLLPKYRGAAPINRAIINGEAETGVTTFFIRKQVDTGTMIDQVRIPIGPNMTAGELHDIMAQTGADLLVETLKKIENDNYTLTVQDESLASKAPKIHREDCLINFAQPAKKVHDFIRGLSPYPAAYSHLQGKMIRLFGSAVSGEDNSGCKPGKITEIGKDIIKIACQPGIITIREIQLEGKKRMAIAEFLRGKRLKVGQMLCA